MPILEITIPSLGESITEVVVGKWLKNDGDWVDKDEFLVELESDKVTQELPSPNEGILKIKEETGSELEIGAVIGSINPDGKKIETKKNTPNSIEPITPASIPAAKIEVATEKANTEKPITPLAQKIARNEGISLEKIEGTGPSGRITRQDVLQAKSPQPPEIKSEISTLSNIRTPRRERMSPLRRKIAERLVQAQQTAAMLTTFNETDMTATIELRGNFKEEFHDRFGVKLGFMSFFAVAVMSALRTFPALNASIIDDDIEYHDYVDLSVAVGTKKGLVVPVVKEAESMGFAQLESTILELANKARDGKLTMDDLTGGTFTISNGGVYGSMMSTPILNPPQSGILGLHRIIKRPVEDPQKPGSIALRPMMYLALSYDHRIVDGSEAVQFLVHIKDCIEHPERLLLGL